mgnify:CR=1 FL=1
MGLAAPAAEAKPTHTAPLAMWALTGLLKSADVNRQLDAYAAAGWGAVLYPRWGLEIEYLSDAWFERIGYLVEQAAARNVEIWLYDEFCWPSGHAKGLVTKDHPAQAAKMIGATTPVSRCGGAVLTISGTPATCAGTADIKTVEASGAAPPGT